MRRIKAVLAGPTGVGKTCIWNRIHSNVFSDSIPTIGAAQFTFPVDSPNGNFEVSLWDTAGQEKYRSLTGNYFRNAGIGILVYDITSIDSFNSLQDFIDLFLSTSPKTLAFYVVGNKLDLENQRQVSTIKGEQLAQKIGAKYFIETSALHRTNIDSLISIIANTKELVFDPEVANISVRESKSNCCDM